MALEYSRISLLSFALIISYFSLLFTFLTFSSSIKVSGMCLSISDKRSYIPVPSTAATYMPLPYPSLAILFSRSGDTFCSFSHLFATTSTFLGYTLWILFPPLNHLANLISIWLIPSLPSTMNSDRSELLMALTVCCSILDWRVKPVAISTPAVSTSRTGTLNSSLKPLMRCKMLLLCGLSLLPSQETRWLNPYQHEAY